MELNELSEEAEKAYEELKAQSATSEQIIAEQTRQKKCNVMTKYLTAVGITKVSIEEVPVTIDGITFDVIPEKYDLSERQNIPAYVVVLTSCPECNKDVWTVVPRASLAGLGEVLQIDFEPRHECPMKQADGPLSEFNDLKPDDVVTWGTLTRLLEQIQQDWKDGTLPRADRTAD